MGNRAPQWLDAATISDGSNTGNATNNRLGAPARLAVVVRGNASLSSLSSLSSSNVGTNAPQWIIRIWNTSSSRVISSNQSPDHALVTHINVAAAAAAAATPRNSGSSLSASYSLQSYDDDLLVYHYHNHIRVWQLTSEPSLICCVTSSIVSLLPTPATAAATAVSSYHSVICIASLRLLIATNDDGVFVWHIDTATLRTCVTIASSTTSTSTSALAKPLAATATSVTTHLWSPPMAITDILPTTIDDLLRRASSFSASSAPLVAPFAPSSSSSNSVMNQLSLPMASLHHLGASYILAMYRHVVSNGNATTATTASGEVWSIAADGSGITRCWCLPLLSSTGSSVQVIPLLCNDNDNGIEWLTWSASSHMISPSSPSSASSRGHIRHWRLTADTCICIRSLTRPLLSEVVLLPAAGTHGSRWISFVSGPHIKLWNIDSDDAPRLLTGVGGSRILPLPDGRLSLQIGRNIRLVRFVLPSSLSSSSILSRDSLSSSRSSTSHMSMSTSMSMDDDASSPINGIISLDSKWSESPLQRSASSFIRSSTPSSSSLDPSGTNVLDESLLSSSPLSALALSSSPLSSGTSIIIDGRSSSTTDSIETRHRSGAAHAHAAAAAAAGGSDDNDHNDDVTCRDIPLTLKQNDFVKSSFATDDIDSSLLASLSHSDNGGIRLWHTNTGRCVRILEAGGAPLTCQWLRSSSMARASLAAAIQQLPSLLGTGMAIPILALISSYLC